MVPKIPTVLLNNGLKMPAIGLGTSMSKGNDCFEAVKAAIDVGYRHLDTAYYYRNEAAVGQAIRAKIDEGVVKREDLFVVTKLWNSYHHPDHVGPACDKSLENLGLDYIDLYLIHMPFGYKFIGWDGDKLMPFDADGKVQYSDDDFIDTWKAMEKLVEAGKVRSIGVSNFNSEQIERILAICSIKPVTNQVECSPKINQKKFIDFCKSNDIVLTAHSPLGRPHLYEKEPEKKPKPVLNEPAVVAMAQKYGVTPTQIVLRYLVEIGAVPVPKSSNVDHLKQNLDIFGFQLSEEDRLVMDSFNSNVRMLSFNKLKDHKYYPFHLEF
ncbi:1,5-anhydro-D-fructose reductase-like [Uranotaenia lowii]|uniref:1,5-anhydro-D-fructose reductase-like n=1 Tax=Uranotaenia lowii TaxID=190385 RepID=UPI0024789858|nr:1,5-anhydro-D-fructose reductase-like [Uranotaenia lowii]